MALPSSGTLGFNTIAASLPLYGTFNPYSLKKMAIITGVGGSWDGSGYWNNNEPYKVSEFYGYAGNGFKYGSPQILLDYALSGFYSGPTSVIKDTSGYSRDGVFVTGTGNGTATNYTGYDSNIGTFNTNTTGQYAIRLPNYAKFSGNEAHTLICWFKVNNFSTSYPGLIACEGRSAGGQPIGYSLYLNQISATTFALNYSRFSGTSGTQYNLNLALGSSPLTTNTWYMAAVTYDGSNIVLYLRYSDNTYAYTTGINSYSIVADASWGCFQGLRYNDWLNGTFGYTAIYYGVLNVLDIFKIQQATRQRYV